MHGAAALDYVQAFPVRADQPASVELDFVALADQPELDGVPEEPAQAFQNLLIFDGCTDTAVALEEIREDFMRVHGDVAEDVVEDVGFGGVFERFAAANPGGGRKAAGCEHLKKRGCGQEPAHRSRVPAGSRLQARADRRKPWQPVLLQADDLEAVEIST